MPNFETGLKTATGNILLKESKSIFKDIWVVRAPGIKNEHRKDKL